MAVTLGNCCPRRTLPSQKGRGLTWRNGLRASELLPAMQCQRRLYRNIYIRVMTVPTIRGTIALKRFRFISLWVCHHGCNNAWKISTATGYKTRAMSRPVDLIHFFLLLGAERPCNIDITDLGNCISYVNVSDCGKNSSKLITTSA